MSTKSSELCCAPCIIPAAFALSGDAGSVERHVRNSKLKNAFENAVSKSDSTKLISINGRFIERINCIPIRLFILRLA
jgi:hypothetical protein